MPSRLRSLLVTALALVELVLGTVLIFAPEEAAGVLFGSGSVPPVALSLVGAALFGFGMLNWMTRHQPVGGIYGRPAVIANLVHYVVGGLALARAAVMPALWVTAAFYLAGALFYGALLFRSPEPA